jgi:hypothetical protein
MIAMHVEPLGKPRNRAIVPHGANATFDFKVIASVRRVRFVTFAPGSQAKRTYAQAKEPHQCLVQYFGEADMI